MWKNSKGIDKGERENEENKKLRQKYDLMKFIEMLHWFAFYVYVPFNKYNDRVFFNVLTELGTVLNVLKALFYYSYSGMQIGLLFLLYRKTKHTQKMEAQKVCPLHIITELSDGIAWTWALTPEFVFLTAVVNCLVKDSFISLIYWVYCK